LWFLLNCIKVKLKILNCKIRLLNNIYIYIYIFAVRHTANVPGQIRFLIVSVITINGINIVGVPWGTECSNIWLVFLIHPNNIKG